MGKATTEAKVLDKMTNKKKKFVHCPAKKNEGQVPVELCLTCKVTTCPNHPNNKEEKVMEKKGEITITLADVGKKLDNIETVLKELVENKIFLMPAGVEAKKVNEPETKGKHKMSKAEKDEIKSELLKGAPYNKEALKELGTKKCRMLASGMGLNTFGKGVEEVEQMILKAQEPKKKAAGKKK